MDASTAHHIKNQQHLNKFPRIIEASERLTKCLSIFAYLLMSRPDPLGIEQDSELLFILSNALNKGKSHGGSAPNPLLAFILSHRLEHIGFSP